jgi:trimeric autotransporter adhesin
MKERTMSYSKNPSSRSRSLTVAFAAAMALILVRPTAAQELLDEHFWITAGFAEAGRVSVFKKTDDTLYLGGNFLYVGPISGAGATFNSETGEPAAPFPNIFGDGATVYDALPDGEGGWFIAGQFTEVAGVEVANLARLRSDGTVEPLPTPNARVEVLALHGTTLYLGGWFTVVDGEPRNRAAAIDISTPAPGGSLLPWNPDVTGDQLPRINDLLIAGPDGPVILGGRFTHMGGVSQAMLAFVDPISGELLPGPDANDMVNTLSLLGETLYVGGHFAQIGGVSRSRLAALDMTSGSVLPWNPNPQGFGVWTVAATETVVYVSGSYNNITGVPRNTPVALHPVSGSLLAWDPGVYGSSVRIIVPTPEGVYLGGSFRGVNGVVNGVPHLYVARVDAQIGLLHEWPVHAGSNVTAIRPSPDGSEVFVGGMFRSVGGLPRRYAAAIDLETGRLTDWNPRPNGGILDMAITEDSAFVVGGFLAIGNPPVTRNYAAEVDLVTGQPTSWTPPPFDTPSNRAVAVTDDYVYVGTSTANFGGGLAELDRVTGAWSGRWMHTNGVKTLLYDRDANLLYVGGAFTALAGVPRNRLGAVDLVTGTATPWHPNLSGTAVQAMACKGDVMYLVGTFNTIGGVARLNAGAVRKSTGEVTPWNPTLSSGSGVHGTGLAVVVGEETVYALGTFTRVGGVLHSFAAALDPETGAKLDWHPQTAGFIFDAILDQSRLYLAGSFRKVFGEIREGFATVTSLEPPSGPLGDLNGDGSVGVADLLILLAAWGPCDDPENCPADLDGDGAVGVADLLILLSNWG